LGNNKVLEVEGLPSGKGNGAFWSECKRLLEFVVVVCLSFYPGYARLLSLLSAANARESTTFLKRQGHEKKDCWHGRII
jgi:hypothetical protein